MISSRFTPQKPIALVLLAGPLRSTQTKNSTDRAEKRRRGPPALREPSGPTHAEGGSRAVHQPFHGVPVQPVQVCQPSVSAGRVEDHAFPGAHGMDHESVGERAGQPPAGAILPGGWIDPNLPEGLCQFSGTASGTAPQSPGIGALVASDDSLPNARPTILLARRALAPDLVTPVTHRTWPAAGERGLRR